MTTDDEVPAMTTDDVTIHRLSAFTRDPAGGNPAGVVVTGSPLAPADMQEIAAAVGYSETAFLVPAGDDAYDVRYFSPKAEVPFCGHATIAAGVHLGVTAGPGRRVFLTPAGAVEVVVERGDDGEVSATLTSVTPAVSGPSPELVDAALAALGYERAELDPDRPPALGYAGAWHLILPVATRERLAELDYDFGALETLMLTHSLTTVALVWRESATRWHARDPFPVGGVVEDPATGAAAAAVGAWLRARGELAPPARFEIVQGEDMGRRSVLTVDVPPGEAGIAVTGTAAPIPA